MVFSQKKTGQGQSERQHKSKLRIFSASETVLSQL